MKNIAIYLLLICGAVGMVACDDFLDAKPQKSLVIPNTLNDFQAILDAEPRLMNYVGTLPLIGADDMVLGQAVLNRLSPERIAFYFWTDEIYTNTDFVDDWDSQYFMIYQTNLVLDGLKDYKSGNVSEQSQIASLEGQARYVRAFGHFALMQLFAKPYAPNTGSNPGIPIRYSADINVETGISTTAEVYEFILEDLRIATALLEDFPEVLTRGSKWSAEALMSRVYLVMQDYEKAYLHASNSLALKNDLMDFNLPQGGTGYTFPRFNKEVIHQVTIGTTSVTFNREQFVNPELYKMYEPGDLRKTVLFAPARAAGFFNMVSRYSGDFYDFGGLATNEVLLNRAESSARIGKESEGLADLNRLLRNRYKKDQFQELVLTGENLMKRILEERRKELLFRGIRWMDLRRLNQDPKYAVTLNRKLNNSDAVLDPNGAGYTIGIPPAEIALNPKIPK